MNRDAQIRELNDIYQLMADGRKGYMETSYQVQDDRLSGLLFRLSEQREDMENELGAELRRFKPDDHTQEGTLKGVLHRRWMDVRAAIGKGDNSTMLDECERGERYLLDRLTVVLEQDTIAPTSRALLIKQREQVEQNLAQVAQLRSDFALVNN